eukprot:13558847-Heterocapsa_arctica.AAC.1
MNASIGRGIGDSRSTNLGCAILQSTVRSIAVLTAVAHVLGLLSMMSCQGEGSTEVSGHVAKQCACARSQKRLKERRLANVVLLSWEARSARSASGPWDIAEEVAMSMR